MTTPTTPTPAPTTPAPPAPTAQAPGAAAPTAQAPPSAGPATAAPPKRKRGTENVRDMLLSMGICTAIVIPIWYLAQPPASDSAPRYVDPTSDIAAFSAAAPGVPVPGVVPPGWKATSSTLDGTRLRIGWITPEQGYVEYAAQRGTPGTFVPEQTGDANRINPLRVGARSFEVFGGRGHTSLVLQQPAGTVVVGGLRETSDDDALTALAQGLR